MFALGLFVSFRAASGYMSDIMGCGQAAAKLKGNNVERIQASVYMSPRLMVRPGSSIIFYDAVKFKEHNSQMIIAGFAIFSLK